MAIPKELTSITPLSRMLAIAMFISLPFIGFIVGLRYEQEFEKQINKLYAVSYEIPYDSKTRYTPPDETANWKTYRFSDNSGFGYELKIPPAWQNQPWAGDGGPDFGPYELLQNFYDKDRCRRFYVHHFLLNTLQKNVNKTEKTQTPTTVLTNPFGIVIEKSVSKNPHELNARINSSKGYYLIHAGEDCPTIDKTFDQILSTFKFLK